MPELRAVVGADIEHGLVRAPLHVACVHFPSHTSEVIIQRFGDSGKVRVIGEENLFLDGEV